MVLNKSMEESMQARIWWVSAYLSSLSRERVIAVLVIYRDRGDARGGSRDSISESVYLIFKMLRNRDHSELKLDVASLVFNAT